MSTPRKRWFRVADSIGRENWNNDTLALCIRLMCHMSMRWARDGLDGEEAALVCLRPGDLMEIAGVRRLDRARARLARLAAEIADDPKAIGRPDIRQISSERSREHPLDVAGNLTSIAVTYLGDITEIRWRKFAEFQEWLSGSRVSSGSNTAPSAPAPAPAPAHKKKEGPQAPPASKEEPLGKQAVAAFCAAFKAKHGVPYPVAKKDGPFLRQLASDIGLSRLAELLPVYFARDDPRLKQSGWNVDGLRWSWQSCDTQAQKSARNRERIEASPVGDAEDIARFL